MSNKSGFNQTAGASRKQPDASAPPVCEKAGGNESSANHPQVLLPSNFETSGSGAEGAVVRLEKRTHFEGGRYKIQLINYGNGLAEIGWSFVPSLKPNKAGRGLSESRPANEDRASRRARSRIRRLILSAKADHLLTLTYRENITDFERSADDFAKFVKRIKAALPGWVYIAVAENQKRGAWHWHIAVTGRQDVTLLRDMWRLVVGDGNIDVRAPRQRDGNVQLLLINYLSKYLGKGFKDGNHELNARRFRASHGIQVPCTIVTLPDDQRSQVLTFVTGTLKLHAGSVGHVWQSEDNIAGWACSWK